MLPISGDTEFDVTTPYQFFFSASVYCPTAQFVQFICAIALKGITNLIKELDLFSSVWWIYFRQSRWHGYSAHQLSNVMRPPEFNSTVKWRCLRDVPFGKSRFGRSQIASCGAPSDYFRPIFGETRKSLFPLNHSMRSWATYWLVERHNLSWPKTFEIVGTIVALCSLFKEKIFHPLLKRV